MLACTCACAAPARLQPLGAAYRRSSTRRQPAQRWRVQASSDGEDLAAQFARAAKRAGIKIPEVEQQQNVATEAPRFTQSPLRNSGLRSGEWNTGPTADTVRRQEQQVLNVWTQERVMQLAAAGTMALVLALLFSAGGPPADPRCTLPWC